MTILIDHRVVCGDIHPGNFIFLRDGRVAVVDLGYAEIYPADRLHHWVSLLLAVIREDRESLRREAVALGLVKNLKAMTLDHAEQIVRAAQRILVKGKSIKLDRSSFFEGLRAVVLPDDRSVNLQLPFEDIRLVHGVLSLFGVLVDFGLEVPWGDRLEQWLMPYAELRKAG